MTATLSTSHRGPYPPSRGGGRVVVAKAAAEAVAMAARNSLRVGSADMAAAVAGSSCGNAASGDDRAGANARMRCNGTKRVAAHMPHGG